MFYFGDVCKASAPVTVGLLPVAIAAAKAPHNLELRFVKLVGSAIAERNSLNHSVVVSLYDTEADRFLVYPSPFVAVGADPQTGRASALCFWLSVPYFLKKNSKVEMFLSIGDEQGTGSTVVPDTGKSVVVYPGFVLGGRIV